MKRRWLLRILIIAFAWFVVSRFAELKHLGETLERGRCEWVLAGQGNTPNARSLKTFYAQLSNIAVGSAAESVSSCLSPPAAE